MQGKIKQSLSPDQENAANPTINVWVQANAGTGKTSVLVERLLRILFRNSDAGILCLTYTNAAAGEMRNRILAALSKWATMDDKELRESLYGIAFNKNPTYDDLVRARSIFYTYIDNPDILKIKTIHGFCEEILRRFPLEAGIAPSWNLVSDSTQRIMLHDAFHILINDKNSAIGDAFSHIVGRISEYSFDELLRILTARYKDFFKVENNIKHREYFIDTTRKFLNIDTPALFVADTKTLEKIINLAENDIKSSKKPAKYLCDIVNFTRQYIDTTINFEEYKKAYLTANDTKISLVSKKDYLADEQDRVYELNQRNLNEKIFADSVALYDLAKAFADTYRELKASRSALDFDDLILYTRKLFSNPDTMGWVLSQLDRGFDHILVDEAQDTSPDQWDILRMLAGDFLTDGDTCETPRSLFVVGDTKQSIYGFQGADPNAFAQSRDEISTQIKNNLRTIREVPLTQSFRSANAILKTVDLFFGDTEITNATGFLNNNHKCFRTDVSGVVEIHPATVKE